MNRSKPAAVVGGGEMKRVTSSVESDASSDGASDARSCRSVAPPAASTGRLTRQSGIVLVVDRTATCMVGFPDSLKNGRDPDHVGRREAAPRGAGLIRSRGAPDDVHAVSEPDEPGTPHDVRAPDDVVPFE